MMEKNSQIAAIGKSAVELIETFFEKNKPRRVFLVRGKRSFISCGAEYILSNLFKKHACRVSEFSDFHENPILEEVNKGCCFFEESKADIIIACGGGSVLDMAKLIRFKAAYNGDLVNSIFKKKTELTPLIALPTTAGTGCEATPFAVCYKKSIKYSVAHNDMLPDYAVILPQFTYNNPSYLTACTGFDALSQSIEAYWNVNATAESDEYAKKAISILWDNLPRVVNAPSNKIRDLVSIAAYWSGCAIAITKTTAPHAFSYAFTTHCGYPHGHAVAISFPFFMALNLLEKQDITFQSRINIDEYYKKTTWLRSQLGFSDRINIQSAMQDYLNDIGLCNNGYGDSNLTMMLDQVNIQRLVNNPVIVTKDIIEQLKNALEKIN